MTETIKKIPLIGVDTGGTFTDLVMADDGRVRVHKLPSTPDDPSRAVLEGVRQLAGDRPALVFHGSTVATNALLEGKGAPTSLVVTAGFRDLLEIGRQNRPQLYALHPRRHKPLCPRSAVVEVSERILADGSVEKALLPEEVERVVAAVLATGASSVAVCLLHAYANPVHEEGIARALEQAGLRVSVSHRILPEYREYERASTTVVNAAVSPVMTGYLDRLSIGLGDSPLRIMQSNGGSIRAATAGAEAVRTILSGPAGGIVGAFHCGQAAGFGKILTFDMGGTSTDVGLCCDEIPYASQTVIAGWPVKVPMVDIHTVGAGGGSIARLDAGGALRVGPESAGADPGPICYGRGEKVTVTDANLYLGRLQADRFLGGRMKLNTQGCRRGIEQLAAEAGITPLHLAEGVLEVAEATMAGALRVVSVEKGYDPREFTLLPFGGAGGLHACALAEKLGVSRILIPVFPGILSALGLVLSDTIRDYTHSVLRASTISNDEIRLLFQPLEQQALDDMRQEGYPAQEVVIERALDIRYRGQSFEVTVPFEGDWGEAFHHRHQLLYGYRSSDRATEIVTLRLRAVARGEGDALSLPQASAATGRPPVMADVTLSGRPCTIPLFERGDIACGQNLVGPALVVEETATHLIGCAWQASCDERGNLVLERMAHD